MEVRLYVLEHFIFCFCRFWDPKGLLQVIIWLSNVPLLNLPSKEVDRVGWGEMEQMRLIGTPFLSCNGRDLLFVLCHVPCLSRLTLPISIHPACPDPPRLTVTLTGLVYNSPALLSPWFSWGEAGQRPR